MKNTVYKKIHTDVMTKIKMGVLRAGDNLSSTRDLARLYKCHRFTVMNVYQDLSAEGWIDASEKSRYVVSEKIPLTTSLTIKNERKKVDLSKICPSVSSFEISKKQYKLEFWGGQPDLRLFPINDFRRVLSSALKRTKPDQLNYGFTDGLPSCVNEVSNYLKKSRNLLNKEIIITNGSQEALMLIFQTFAKKGDKIAIERKGYPPAWNLFESLGAILIPIEVDAEGIDTEDLSNKIKKHDIKLIYVTPLHQYPTTVTLSPRRRQKLIQLSEQNLIPLLEDDYDHEFHYIGPPPPPLSAETSMGIYICSFSKILFPGIRLGAIACNSEIKKNISYHKHIISRQTDCLSQIGLSAWIKDGGFEMHLRKMRRIYENRFYFMLEQLEKIKMGSKVSWHTPTGGMSIWTNLERDSKKIADIAKNSDVFFQNESSMDYLKSTGTHLRIGFARVTEKEMLEGLKILRKLL